MDSSDVVDEVNALLKLGVGDPYRLEHIKQTYIQNQKIWITDENYLKRLREKYLVKHTSDVPLDENIVFENEPEDNETIHCWKCGKKGPLGANFCMICGTSLFEVGSNPQPVVETASSIIGAAYSQGYFDTVLEPSDTLTAPVIENKVIFYGEYDPKCGDGTVLDPETNACRLGSVKTSSSGETDSKCGPGTVFDSESNSCILE
jgi:hypothetical protein